MCLALLASVRSVSYKTVMPVLSSMLKLDTPLYTRPSPIRDHPPSYVLGLDETSSCPCSAERDFYNPLGPSVTRRCKLYTLTTLLSLEIQLQNCPSAPGRRRRFIGPDLREHGIFNYNNSTLVTHKLLDEYTMAYVTSETPFTAFVAVLGLRYSMSGTEFMGEDLLRSVWFAYVVLQAYNDDMSCGRCGPYPDTCIWDGVTLAFAKKHITGNLEPPTTRLPTSVIRRKVKNQPKQKLIQDINLRRQLRQSLDRPTLTTEALDGDAGGSEGEDELGSEVEGGTPDEGEQLKQIDRLKQYFSLLDKVHLGLTLECPQLADLFIEVCGAASMQHHRKVPSIYRSFFMQVSCAVKFR